MAVASAIGAASVEGSDSPWASCISAWLALCKNPVVPLCGAIPMSGMATAPTSRSELAPSESVTMISIVPGFLKTGETTS